MPRGAENPEGRFTGKEPQMEEEKLLRRGESNKAQPIMAKDGENDLQNKIEIPEGGSLSKDLPLAGEAI